MLGLLEQRNLLTPHVQTVTGRSLRGIHAAAPRTARHTPRHTPRHTHSQVAGTRAYFHDMVILCELGGFHYFRHSLRAFQQMLSQPLAERHTSAAVLGAIPPVLQNARHAVRRGCARACCDCVRMGACLGHTTRYMTPYASNSPARPHMTKCDMCEPPKPCGGASKRRHECR